MKALQHSSTGDPAEVLELVERPSQPLKPGEVRVQVLATPIHPSNLLQIAGQYGVQAKLPAIPGSEGVGRVVEAAPGAALTVGQPVLLSSGAGTWCSEVVGPAQGFVPVPDTNLEQLAMLVVNPLTAYLMLTQSVSLSVGDWVVQSAANSAVGQLLIQLAKKRGMRTVNVVRRESLIPELQALGADAVVLDEDGLAQRIREATGGAGPALAIDAVGGATFSSMVASLAPGATMITYGLMSGRLPKLDVTAAIFRGITVRGFWLQTWFQTASAEARQEAFGTLIPMIASGELSAKIEARYPLEQFGEAVARAAQSGRDGKVLLTP